MPAFIYTDDLFSDMILFFTLCLNCLFLHWSWKYKVLFSSIGNLIFLQTKQTCEKNIFLS